MIDRVSVVYCDDGARPMVEVELRAFDTEEDCAFRPVRLTFTCAEEMRFQEGSHALCILSDSLRIASADDLLLVDFAPDPDPRTRARELPALREQSLFYVACRSLEWWTE